MILLGDCLERLKELEENSVDAVVTDPPYGLKFMGKKWDANVPSKDVWSEVLRVLKPGGHLLSFGGTRTYHHMAIAIELSGFEIRDQIQWLYGSGFPKSHDISKGIDKAAGAEREVVGIREDFAARANKVRIGENLMDVSIKDGSFSNPQTVGQITMPMTDLAKQWQGWGTALKPANEPIVLARKPLEKGLTVAQNVLKWGVGGLNIDASRIGYNSEADKLSATPQGKVTSKKPEDGYAKAAGVESERHEIPRPALQGRWPSNLLLDETAAEMLDEQSGTLKSGDIKKDTYANMDGRRTEFHTLGKQYSREVRPHKGDAGGASRFFYVAKASKRERNAGLKKEKASVDKTEALSNDSSLISRSVLTEQPSSLNFHPTVKPLKLMEYLIRLITPPNGTVLDPFMGSGSTGVAAFRLGFKFIGIEMNEEYLEIARKRIETTESSAG